MDIQAEKIQLIEWLASLNKPLVIKKLVALKEGVAQANRGRNPK